MIDTTLDPQVPKSQYRSPGKEPPGPFARALAKIEAMQTLDEIAAVEEACKGTKRFAEIAAACRKRREELAAVADRRAAVDLDASAREMFVHWTRAIRELVSPTMLEAVSMYGDEALFAYSLLCEALADAETGEVAERWVATGPLRLLGRDVQVLRTLSYEAKTAEEAASSFRRRGPDRRAMAGLAQKDARWRSSRRPVPR